MPTRPTQERMKDRGKKCIIRGMLSEYLSIVDENHDLSCRADEILDPVMIKESLSVD